MTTVRTGKCRHARVTGRGWAYQRWYVEAASTKHCPSASALVCQSCGAWLPLGPARDTPETEIELRAALVADEFAKTTDAELLMRTSIGERRGWWMSAKNDATGLVFWVPVTTAEVVGYLAREIFKHDDGGAA
jgi:hypothetical protein